jgi:WD40 repeat protein
VDFSADGRRLVTAGMDDTVRVWALDIEDLHRMAEDSLTRGFTEAECRQHLHLESCADR